MDSRGLNLEPFPAPPGPRSHLHTPATLSGLLAGICEPPAGGCPPGHRSRGGDPAPGAKLPFLHQDLPLLLPFVYAALELST